MPQKFSSPLSFIISLLLTNTRIENILEDDEICDYPFVKEHVCYLNFYPKKMDGA